MKDRYRILFLAAEVSPWVKIGGLGDVAGSLPIALRELESSPDIRVTLPYYPFLKDTDLKTEPVAAFTISTYSGTELAEVYQSKIGQIPIYLIDGAPIAASEAVYTSDNYLDGKKFVFFSLASLELARTLDWKPDIVHAHDWHAASAVYHLRLIRSGDTFFQDTKSLLTVHNYYTYMF